MRSSGVPDRTASMTRRTAARTSSSASEAVRTRVVPDDTGRGGGAVARSGASSAGSATPMRVSVRATPASASARPVTPTTTVVGRRCATAATSSACRLSRS